MKKLWNAAKKILDPRKIVATGLILTTTLPLFACATRTVNLGDTPRAQTNYEIAKRDYEYRKYVESRRAYYGEDESLADMFGRIGRGVVGMVTPQPVLGPDGVPYRDPETGEVITSLGGIPIINHPNDPRGEVIDRVLDHVHTPQVIQGGKDFGTTDGWLRRPTGTNRDTVYKYDYEKY